MKQLEYLNNQTELVKSYITLLESTRGQTQLYRDELINTYSWDADKDVRVNILNQINQILTPHVMNLCFNVQYVTHHSFQREYFKTNTFKDSNTIYNSYTIYNKNGLIYSLSAIIERYLRLIAKELDSTIDISKGFYGIRKKVFETIGISKNSNEWKALSLLSFIRNTIHNNGIYINKNDENFTYRNFSYSFVNNFPHDYATYENLNNIIKDMLSLIKAINGNSVLIAKDSFIDECLYRV